MSRALKVLHLFCKKTSEMRKKSTSLESLYQTLSRQEIIISSLGNIDDVITELKQASSVTAWKRMESSQSLRLEFSGDMAASAELLRSLIEAGIPITEFHRQQEDLESIFLKLGHQQVS